MNPIPSPPIFGIKRQLLICSYLAYLTPYDCLSFITLESGEMTDHKSRNRSDITAIYGGLRLGPSIVIIAITLESGEMSDHKSRNRSDITTIYGVLRLGPSIGIIAITVKDDVTNSLVTIHGQKLNELNNSAWIGLEWHQRGAASSFLKITGALTKMSIILIAIIDNIIDTVVKSEVTTCSFIVGDCNSYLGNILIHYYFTFGLINLKILPNIVNTRILLGSTG
jgi:hypothetical protein